MNLEQGANTRSSQEPSGLVLIVEDNRNISEMVGEYLEGRGFEVDFAADGLDGYRLAAENSYDVIVLDLMLPVMDGWQVCRRLREDSPHHVPILMLTARDSLDDKLEGFAAGADDYLTKPFAMEEIEVRCNVLSRRHLLNRDIRLTIGEVVIDRKSQRVTRAGTPIELHHLGYRILLLLAEAYPGVVTRSELMSRLWGDDPPDTDALRTHIYLLRQAIDKPFSNSILVTVHGVGFKLEPAHG